MKDAIFSLASQGNALQRFLVIDAHAHLGRCPLIHAAYADASGLKASMDRIGIQTTCISAFQSLGGDVKKGNNAVAEAVKQFPGRFIGYGTLNPLFPDEMLNELDRCLDTLGLWAIKLHPTMHRNTSPDADIYHRVYACMEERRGVILSHTFGSPDILDKLSNTYPNVTFIYAHVGATYDAKIAEALAPLMRERNNVYIDTVLSVVPWGHIEQWVNIAGSDRILFGSDVPFNDNAHQIGRLTHASLSERDKIKILGINMAELLKRTGGWAESMNVTKADIRADRNVESGKT